MKKTTDAIEILDSMDAHIPDREARRKEARINGNVALEVYRLREKAGLTQEQLAALVACEPLLIDDLESGNFDGDSLPIMQKIADALGVRLNKKRIYGASNALLAGSIE